MVIYTCYFKCPRVREDRIKVTCHNNIFTRGSNSLRESWILMISFVLLSQ